MSLIQRYITSNLLTNLAFSLTVFILLFLVVDFIDRIDTIISEDASLSLTIQYFLFKIPQMLTLVTPIAMITATLVTIGLLSRNSEITAMRASGISVLYLASPVLLVALGLSIASLVLSQTLVPLTNRRVKEIYNIDIRKKDLTGTYNQTNFWWRDDNYFYSSRIFDSRTRSLNDLIRLSISPEMKIETRLDAESVTFVREGYGWLSFNASERFFSNEKKVPKEIEHNKIPLLLNRIPKEFYSSSPEPDSMSYFELKDFIAEQKSHGLATTQYQADLYEKLSFPFITLVVTFVVFSFALLPARSGSMATPILIALGLGFSYYAFHSFAVSLGRAELLPAFLSAWVTNLVYSIIGVILIAGAERG